MRLRVTLGALALSGAVLTLSATVQAGTHKHRHNHQAHHHMHYPVLSQPILREPSLTFGKLQSMECSLVPDSYWDLLPARHETISPEEEELDRIFGVDGELSARWL